MPAPWLLFSPSHVVHFVQNRDALSLLADASDVRLDHLELLVGLKIQYKTNARGEKYAVDVAERGSWMLFSRAWWIVREDDPTQIMCVGADLNFFVDNFRPMRVDMNFFKAQAHAEGSAPIQKYV